MSDDDRKLISDAIEAWNRIRGAESDQAAYERLLLDETEHPLSDEYGRSAAWRQILARWAEGGYGWMRTSKTFAAALICTDTATLERADIETTWKTLLVEAPSDLFVIHGESYDRIFVDLGHFTAEGAAEDTAVHLVLFDSANHVNRRSWLPTTLQAFLGVRATEHGEELRAFQAAARLVLGLLMAVQYTNNFRTREYPAIRASGTWRKGVPQHRVAVVGHEVKTDFSEEVRAYVSGRRSGVPAVQSLVRGHYKRQVVGLARSGRKVIWIEPYWRGPDDAPILARPHNVSASNARHESELRTTNARSEE